MGVTVEDWPTKCEQYGPSLGRRPMAMSASAGDHRVSIPASADSLRFRMMLLVEFVMYD